MKKSNPWDRQDGEGDNPFYLFRLFLKQKPPRSIIDLAKEAGTNEGTTRNKSWKWKWFERARAWDARVQEVSDAETLSEVARLRRVHIRQLQHTRDIGYSRIAIAGEEKESLPENIEVKDATKLFFESLKNERLVMGEATERTEQAAKWDLSKLSQEEIQTLRELKRKATDDSE